MTTFQPSPAFRFANRLLAPLIRSGLPMGMKKTPMALLTVFGRKSGVPRTTPVALASFGDGWLLVAVYGVSDWSRNLEAAGGGTITLRGSTHDVEARRLPPHEAASILRDAITDAPAMVRRMTEPYFSADERSPIEDWQEESIAHPVFILSPR